MSKTAATFDRINAIVDKTAKEIQNMLIQMPGTQISSKSPAPSAAPRIVKKKKKASSKPAPGGLSDEVRVSPLHTARASASSSGSQMSAIIQKHKGAMSGARVYRSLDKKHLLVVNTVKLDKAMDDQEAKRMESAMKTHSEVSLRDYVPPSTSGRQITYL